MEKIWYIAILGNQEGPYSAYELKKDARVSFETFVWKEGFDQWKKLGGVPELKNYFEEQEQEQEEEDTQEVKENLAAQDELVLDMGDPPNFLWIFIAVIMIAYFLGQLLWR